MSLKYWADVGDNRIGPILLELVEALIDEGDADKMKKVANRLKFMSGSLHSYASRIESPCESPEALGANKEPEGSGESRSGGPIGGFRRLGQRSKPTSATTKGPAK